MFLLNRLFGCPEPPKKKWKPVNPKLILYIAVGLFIFSIVAVTKAFFLPYWLLRSTSMVVSYVGRPSIGLWMNCYNYKLNETKLISEDVYCIWLYDPEGDSFLRNHVGKGATSVLQVFVTAAFVAVIVSTVMAVIAYKHRKDHAFYIPQIKKIAYILFGAGLSLSIAVITFGIAGRKKDSKDGVSYGLAFLMGVFGIFSCIASGCLFLLDAYRNRPRN